MASCGDPSIAIAQMFFHRRSDFEIVLFGDVAQTLQESIDVDASGSIEGKGASAFDRYEPAPREHLVVLRSIGDRECGLGCEIGNGAGTLRDQFEDYEPMRIGNGRGDTRERRVDVVFKSALRDRPHLAEFHRCYEAFRIARTFLPRP